MFWLSVCCEKKLLGLPPSPPRLKERLMSAVDDSLKICGTTQDSGPYIYSHDFGLLLRERERERSERPSACSC
jgi:hypothetical protein